jgi:hypothetical protein
LLMVSSCSSWNFWIHMLRYKSTLNFLKFFIYRQYILCALKSEKNVLSEETSRFWSDGINATLLHLNFSQCYSDPCDYVIKQGSEFGLLS